MFIDQLLYYGIICTRYSYF